MKCLREGLRREGQKRKKKLDRVPMDIRVRRSDELFLIHREPTEEEKRLAKKENTENDPIQAEEERRTEARTRMKKGRTPEQAEITDQRWVIPPLEQEDVTKIVGEYILPTDASEIKAVKEEFEKKLKQKNQDLDELLGPSEDVPWSPENQKKYGDQQDNPGMGSRKTNRKRKAPDRFQAGL